MSDQLPTFPQYPKPQASPVAEPYQAAAMATGKQAGPLLKLIGKMAKLPHKHIPVKGRSARKNLHFSQVVKIKHKKRFY
jgi:hypothetical protein